jgi:hypothetical protein
MSLSVFSHDLSIKLPDSYIVSIKWNKGDSEYTVLRSCTQFQPPVVKYKKEIQNFGNNGYAFLIPEWEVDDFTLTFNEDTHFNSSKIVSHAMQYLFDFSDDKWYYKQNSIYEIIVDVYDNNFNKIVYRYTYRYLKLVKYENYQLDYSNDALTSISMTFSFMYANETTCNIDPNSSNIPDITDTTQDAPPATSLSQDIAEDYNKPAMKPEDGNTQKDNGNQQTPEQVAAQALETQKTETEPTPKTEEVQTPSAQAPESNDQEIVLDNVDIKAGEGQSKTKETAATNPVDLNKLSGDDRIDELAYRMMRGQLDNGKPRYDKTYKAGYTESERAAAQGIVNQKDWEGLKERHDARVANKDTHYSTAAETEVAKNDYTPMKDITQSRTADVSTPASQSTGGQSAADAAAKARLAAEQRNKSQDVAVNTKPVEQKHETQQPKQQETQVAKTEPKKSEEKKQPKQEATQVAQSEPKKEPKSNGKAQISEDQYGNVKVENDTGTLYKTKDGQKYYKLKDNDTIFMADNNNKLKESKAHDGLVVETINGDTQIYQSIQQGGNEIYRERNVTQEVMTSDGIKESLDRKQATRDGGRSGNQYNRGRGGEAAAAAAAAKSAQQQHASAQSSSQKVKTT